MEEKRKLLSPTNDVVFQCLFGKQENESITRDLISKILRREIAELNLNENPRLIPKYPERKYGVVDVKAREKETGKMFDLEMQTSSPKELPERILYYWSELYSGQLERGNSYSSLKPAILIILLKENLGMLKEIKKYHTKWNIIEEKDRRIILTDNLEIHIIEMNKLIKIVGKEDELSNWIEFLKNPESGGNMDVYDEIKKAKEELERLTKDPEVRRMAELRERWEKDEKSNIESAREEGREEGIKEGREEGIKEGRRNNQIEIAKEMIKKKYNIDTICDITNLTKEEIEKIKEEIN